MAYRGERGLAGWLAGWVACWLAGWLAGSLAGWLCGWRLAGVADVRNGVFLAFPRHQKKLFRLRQMVTFQHMNHKPLVSSTRNA